ncbi:MAG: M1 family metallopeptidase [Woeseiaceae bacterium]
MNQTSLLFSALIGTGLLLNGCSDDQVRNDVVVDTGLPLTDNMRSYDVDRYTLRHEILVARKSIAGFATITFDVLARMDVLELDFDGNYDIDFVESDGDTLAFEQTESKLFVHFTRPLEVGESGNVTVSYTGQPLEAKLPPWDGGFTWEQTPSGKPWIATSFQGEGCDIWWPCKDHPSDEPSGIDLFITVPSDLIVAANGVLIDVIDEGQDKKTFHWQSNVSTNTYGVAINIAPYVAIESEYQSTNGTAVPVVFYAIEDHEEEARSLFDRDMHPMIEFFERVVGPYPWGHEKIGIAETPHLGMEHQTINAYGNEFKRDDYGFDWLLHHEFSHEWFGNLISAPNNADLWLHEGAGAYMQMVFTQETMGDAAAHHRMYKSYLAIDSCLPVAPRGEFSVDQMNAEETGSAVNIYTKGSWVMHSLRYLLGDDRFWAAVRMLVYDNSEPAKQVGPISARHRTTDDFLRISSEIANSDLSWFFEVYLRTGELPELVREQVGADIVLRWNTAGDLPFNMPVPVRINGAITRVEFLDNTARLSDTEQGAIQIDPNMQVLRKLPSLPTCEEQRAEKADSQQESGSEEQRL